MFEVAQIWPFPEWADLLHIFLYSSIISKDQHTSVATKTHRHGLAHPGLGIDCFAPLVEGLGLTLPGLN